MSEPIIYVAHSRNRQGFTCYSYESWPSYRADLPHMKSGRHIAGGDTLEEARKILDQRIADDWRRTERPLPEIIDKGRVRELFGRNYSF